MYRSTFYCTLYNETGDILLTVYSVSVPNVFTASPMDVVVFKCRNVVKLVRRNIGEIVRYLPERKKNKISAASQTVATARIAPKICQGQPPTFGSHFSRFHPNRFTFGLGGVIAERVKTVLLRHRVLAR